MAFKLLTFISLLATACAGLIPATEFHHHVAPIAVGVKSLDVAPAHTILTNSNANDDFDPHPQYKFGYGVQDHESGDSKSQVEERDGDVVRGEYSLIDADGYKRTVQYTADDHHGFNAVVSREPLAVKTAVASAVLKTPVTTHVVAHDPHAVVKTVEPVIHHVSPIVEKTLASVVSHAAAGVPTAYFTHH